MMIKERLVVMILHHGHAFSLSIIPEYLNEYLPLYLLAVKPNPQVYLYGKLILSCWIPFHDPIS